MIVLRNTNGGMCRSNDREIIGLSGEDEVNKNGTRWTATLVEGLNSE